MTELSAGANAVLRCIREYQSRVGVPPTRQEIADSLGYASANAVQELGRLHERGCVNMSAEPLVDSSVPDAESMTNSGS